MTEVKEINNVNNVNNVNDLPINQVVCGAFPAIAREWPSEKINLVMFSPPYWGLRNYGENVESDWADGWRGQLGLEPDYRMYIEHMVEVGREIKRILRKDGSWYLNLGDTYFGDSPVREKSEQKWEREFTGGENRRSAATQSGIKAKCKLLMPYRVALALVDDGWICRNDITWFKSNAMPSSVKDRLTCQTERVFHLIKSRKYYYDLDAIREPHSTATIKRVTQPTIFGQKGGFKQDALNPLGPGQSNFNRPAEMAKSLARRYAPFNLRVRDVKRGKFGTTAQEGKLRASEKEVESYGYPETNEGYVHPLGKNPGDIILTKHDKAVGRTKRSYTDSLHAKEYHPLGANPSDFWGITTQPSNDYWCSNCKDFVKQKDMRCVRCRTKILAHFAVYPEALCERPIKSSCPTQVCRKCGRPRERIVERPNMDERPIRKTDKADGQHPHVNWDGYPRSAGQAWLEWRRKNPDRTIGWTDCGCGGFEPGIVLDPMCGSGTTLVVAKKLGLRYIGIDLNENYVEMSRKRLAQVEWPLEAFA